MTACIHPTAIVDPSARLGVDVAIGPFAIVEPRVVIGDRTRVMAYAFIADGCVIGPDCEVHMGAILGHAPQIRDARPPFGGLSIEAGAIVREQVSIHRARRPGDCTVIGRESLLLAGCHIAHDCRVGDSTTVANGALLAGHVRVGDRAYISGNVVIHQHVQVGELSMIGGAARVTKDVPPFMVADGQSLVRAVNAIGLRRAGMTEEQRRRVRTAFDVLYRMGLNVTHAVERLRLEPPSPEFTAILEFIASSRRGICAGGPRGRRLRSAELDVLG